VHSRKNDKRSIRNNTKRHHAIPVARQSLDAEKEVEKEVEKGKK
jgi:hypothetical protein